MISNNLHIFLKKNLYLITLCFLVFFLGGCSVTKKIPAGESLYVGSTVKVVADSAISKDEIKKVQAQLTEFVKPKPNATLFGFPYKVWFYYLLGEPKSEKGIKNFFRKRFGEPPVLASKSVTLANTKQIGYLLNNEGYFRSFATGEFSEKNRKSTAVYTTTLHQRYYLDSVTFSPQDTSVLGKIFNTSSENSLLKPGSPYRFELISGERNRIDLVLKKKGFYFFQPDFIIIKADSSIGNHKVNLSVEIKPSTSQVARKIYRIRDVHVLSDYGDIITEDSLKNKSSEVAFKGIKVNDKTDSFNPKIFSQAIGFRRGGRYSSNIQDISLSRLINLNGNFKFVKNTFELVPRSDSALLDVFYYLTPLKAKSFVAGIDGVTKSNNYTGTNLSVSWLNKNTFRGAELLTIKASTGLDFQVGGISSTLGAVNSSRFSLEGNISIPRFIIPFLKLNPARSQALPKTNIGIGYILLKRGGLYDLTSLSASMSYAWKQNKEIEHSLTPISINLVKATNISQEFTDDIFRSDNPAAILSILENKLIMSSSYTISYIPTPLPNSKHQFRFTGGVEVAGNLANLLSKIGSSDGTLVGVAYAQYARLDADFRYTYSLTKSLQIANRLVGGYGLPYGNSYTLPSVKQYSAGGNNSIRAFAARSIGPGNYSSNGTIGNALLGSQTGDIKLEFNTELRAKFNKYINGAFFIDAGNVWMQKNADDYGEGAVFGSEFYKQIAIGTGIGLRLDFSYLVLRFDLATPVRKPYLPEGERWVLKDFNLRDSQWRSDNLVLNIAVGYPF
ncbi:MAG: BamA/TamA family outer membrane protein [Bacteroidota bacterium]|jgi:outer membrane protein assembly factor BamA